MTGENLKNNPQATHSHKKVGSVVLMESTTVLAKVLSTGTGDEFWVKLADLTPLDAIDESKPTKKTAKDRPNASANSRYRVVRAA
jgi:GTP-dependent phosphoenolpyruvate carboxykinase